MKRLKCRAVVTLFALIAFALTTTAPAETLPADCIAVTVGNIQYQDCDGSFYRTAFQGNKLLYVVVEKPL